MHLRTVLLTTALVLSLAAPTVAPAARAGSTGQSCSFPVAVTDATGTEVTVEEEPTRVVTLSPSAAQTMWEIGAREKVVGVTKYADYLDGAESRTQVSTTEQMVSFETVLNLTPDLVLAPNVVSPETVEKLREAGVTVYYFQRAETIEDVYGKTRRTGRLVGECRGADETVSWMRERVGVAREAAEGRERPDVLYLFFGYTAGRGSFIDEIIEAAGGDNVAAEANVTGYQQLSEEVVIRADPDWLVRNSENPIGMNEDVINQTTAARLNQTVVVQIEHLNQPAPRIVHAVTKLAKHFHPEAYAVADATETATSTPRATTARPPTSAATPTAPTGTTGSPGQAGFGAVLAAVGIAAGVLLSRRA